jgi:hypothetical protein
LFSQATDVHQNGSFRLILIANTADVDIGASCKKDIDRAQKTFGDIASLLGLDFTYTEVSGTSFDKTDVLAALNNLNTSASDIIVVCYTGHGFHYQNDQDAYPSFDLTTSPAQPLNSNTLSFSSVYNILSGKTARFKMLLADCCNSYVMVAKPFGPSNPNIMRSRVQWSKTNGEALFVHSSGIVAASATSVGEVAMCNADMGGYFLYNFVESLDKALSVFQGNVSWNNIFAETKAAVLNMTSNRNCAAPICTETAISYIQLN